MATKKSTKPVRDKLKEVLPSGSKDSNFFQLVHDVARLVPYGRVTTYGAIAACLGARKSARMVGWAMQGSHNTNPPVPAHRVINRNGMLSGKNHFETPTQMAELLAAEGVEVINDKVVAFEKLFWDPGKEV